MGTHTVDRFGWVFAIAGMGLRRSATASNMFVGSIPIATVGTSMQPALSRFDCPYVNAIARDSDGSPLIAATSCAIRPMTGDVQIGTFSLTLQINEQYPEISRFFFGTKNTREPTAVTTNGVALTPQGLAISVPSGYGSRFATEDLVYWGREAFRVDYVTTGSPDDTIYIYNQIPDPSTPGLYVTRSGTTAAAQPFGHASTIRRDHSASANGSVPPYNDNRLWLDNPMVEGREVYVYRTDGETETLYGVYIITGRPRMSADGLTFQVEMQDTIGMMAERELNASPNVYTVTDARGVPGHSIGMDLTIAAKTAKQVQQDRVWPFRFGVFQVGQSVVTAENTASDTGVGTLFIGFLSTGPLRTYYQSEQLPDMAGLVKKKVYEILISDPCTVRGASPMPPFITDATTHPYYVDDATWSITGIADHPLTQLLVHLSQLDAPNMPAHWRVDLPPNTVDTAEILRLRDQDYAWAVRHIGVIAGADGKPVNCLKWLSETFLRPFGLSFATNAQGQITVRSVVNVTSFLTLGTGRVLPGRGMSLPSEFTRSQWEMKVGQAFKDQDAVNTIAVTDGYIDELFPYRTQTGTMYAAGVLHADEQLPADIRTQDPIASLANIFVTVGQMFRFPLQLLEVEVTGATRVLAGDWVAVNAPGIIDDETGVPYLPEDTPDMLGLVLEAAQDVAHDQGYELKVLRFPIDLAYIAPAGNIASLDSSDTVTLNHADYIKPLDGSGEYTTGDRTFDSDASTFFVGQAVQIFSKAMALKTKVTFIESITGDVVVMTADIKLLDNSPYAYVAGDVLCASTRNKADNDSLAEFAYLGHTRYSL